MLKGLSELMIIKFKVYMSGIYTGTIESDVLIDGNIKIHIPVSMANNWGNKYFYVDLVEV